MKISRITLTGADDAVELSELLKLSEQHDRIEWGILMSKKRGGTPQYPSHGWLKGFARLVIDNPEIMRASAHLCGDWARTAASGDWDVFQSRSDVMPAFDRVQVNLCDTRIDPHNFTMSLMRRSILGKQIILQYDQNREDIDKALLIPGCDIVPLFDRSRGLGTVPDKWPSQMTRVVQPGAGARSVRELMKGRETLIYCGYAGGLSPDNIRAQLERIETVAHGNIWIDATSGLRDGTDNFCLAKISKFLDAIYAFEQCKAT